MREKEYPLQDDHMRIILEAKEREEKDTLAKAEEEKAALKAEEAKGASPAAMVNW